MRDCTENDFLETSIVPFLANHTGISEKRILGIYRAGKPWPIFGKINFVDEAIENETPIRKYILDNKQLIFHLADETERKVSDYYLALDRGESPGPIPELELEAEKNEIFRNIAEKSGEEVRKVKLVAKNLAEYYGLIDQYVEDLLKNTNNPKLGS
ncbi:MAG: hypothetical protein HYR80_08990 [Nitrospirae bacterium]|nr:hypothetical protein [Nitrospirota bacterium]